MPDADALETTSPPVAEAVYAKLLHDDGKMWLLAFDIDADDVATTRLRDSGDDRTDAKVLSDSSVATDPPQAEAADAQFSYTYRDVRRALEYAHELRDWVQDALGCSKTHVFYSGQGAHLYVLDEDICQSYHMQARRALTEYITDELGIPIDVEVTYSAERVLRLPCSLHAGVSRIVTEAPSPEFEFRNHSEAVPAFLTDR